VLQSSLLAMLFVRINAVQCFAEERLNCETLRSVVHEI
jgi:hypothetical protein